MSASIAERLAMVEPPIWSLASLPLFQTDSWLSLFESLATYREQQIEAGQPLTGSLRVTSEELTGASPALLALLDLLQTFGLVEVTGVSPEDARAAKYAVIEADLLEVI